MRRRHCWVRNTPLLLARILLSTLMSEMLALSSFHSFAPAVAFVCHRILFLFFLIATCFFSSSCLGTFSRHSKFWLPLHVAASAAGEQLKTYNATKGAPNSRDTTLMLSTICRDIFRTRPFSRVIAIVLCCLHVQSVFLFSPAALATLHPLAFNILPGTKRGVAGLESGGRGEVVRGLRYGAFALF